MELRLDIDPYLHERLSDRAEQHGFESTERYSEAILEAVIDELEGDDRDEDVKEHLEDLGYL